MLSSILGAAGGIASSLLGNSAAKKAAKKAYNQQVSFAQNAIQWKVEDAKKAGIHPLYALGANTTSFNPVAVGSSTPDLGAMGADIGRSIDAVSSSSERVGSAALQRLTLERAQLENDLLRANISGSRVRTLSEASQIGPPFPGLIPTKSVDPQQTTGLNVGKGFVTNPHFSDAQTIEDRYGDSEILSMLSAIINGGADAYYNLYRPSLGKVRPYRNPSKMGR